MLTACAFGSTGCSLLYSTQRSGVGFTVYSDRSPEFVARVSRDIERIRQAYLELFNVDPQALAPMTIVLAGEDDSASVVDHGYTPNVLGYYVPVFDFISVDASPRWPGADEILDQIILHEVAHHFLVSIHPPASQKYWLNEGLAGNLEMTLSEDDHFEYVLFHPQLYRAARNAARDRDEPIRVRDLVEMSWGEFHDDRHKADNYALAWALVWYALERGADPQVPLGKRIRDLIATRPIELEKLEKEWNAFLRGFDVTGYMVGRAADRSEAVRLTARWAVRELERGRGPDDVRALRGLAGLLADPRPDVRTACGTAFLRRLEATPCFSVLGEPWVDAALATVAARATDPAEPVASRLPLIEAMGESFVYRSHWIPLLVRLLEHDEPDVRAGAARSLAIIAGKPTITNPEFWRRGAPAARAQEAADWRAWWALREKMLSEQRTI